jgi:hypothetical protein
MDEKQPSTGTGAASMTPELAEVINALEHVVPPMPSADAPCHRDICPQSECAHCQRVKTAHEAIELLRGLE